MSDVVFILGAGASRQCGAPLMTDFLDISYRLLRANLVNDKRAEYELVFRAIGALQAVHSKAQLDLTNIESIFTSLEIANVLGKLPGFDASEIPDIIAALKDVIVKTLETTIDFPVDGNYIGVPEPYEEFANLLNHLREKSSPKNSVSVITFNYDVAVDMAMYRAGLGPDYGMPPEPPIHNPVSLLKLHGSLNWAIRSDTKNIHPLQLNQYFQKYSLNGYRSTNCKIHIGSQLKEYYSRYTEIEVESEPFIVPPAWNKSNHHAALSKVWSLAAKHLGEAHTIFICGYSLPETDAFFRLLYALGTVGSSPLEKIVVYNPDSSGVVEKRFRDMLGPGAESRFSYELLTFAQCMPHIKNFFPT